MKFDVFLSHNSLEKPAVERIAEQLKRAGFEPWLDKWCLTVGGNWQDELAEGLRSSSSCAVFIGPNGIGDWARLEFQLATDRMTKDRNFRVFLVFLPDLPDPFDTSQLPPFLTTRTWVDLRKGINDPRTFQQLVNAIKGLAPGPEIPIGPRDDISPYRGLQTFDEEHAEFFFGRDADIQRLIEKLKTTRLLAVVGPSGCGKSSLVRAGLLPALKRGELQGSDAWAIRVFTPGERPLTQLAANMQRLYPQAAAGKLLDELSADEHTLNLQTAVALADRPSAERVLWVVDQFEEIFTLCRDEAERRQFIANLLYAALAPGGRSVVVLTMRADFYQKCAAYPELSAQLISQQFLVSPMSVEGLRQAIQEPARRTSLDFEPGLVETILDDVESQPGALPLLEHALLELWHRRRARLLTLEAYRESGGVEGAIAKRADTTYESFDAEQQSIVRRVMLRLTQPGEGTEDTRRRAAMSELITNAAEADKVERVVQTLADARLLMTDSSAGTETVDVSHEALIRGWPRLRRWIEEDRAGLRILRRVTEAAQEWQKAKDESLLFRGVRLAQAAELRERNEDALNNLEREFLVASAQLQMRERKAARRRTRRIVLGLTTALVLIGIFLVLTIVQGRVAKQQRTEASARELAASSLAQLSINPERALLLAVEAAKLAHTAETENALRQALIKSPVRVLDTGMPRSEDETQMFSATFSPDARIISATYNDRTQVWDWESKRNILEVRNKDMWRIPGVIFSPDGKRVMKRDVDKAEVWDVGSGQKVFELKAGDKLSDACYAPDGKLIATSFDGEVQIWDAASGSRVAKWRIDAAGTWVGLEFSPDSKSLLVGSRPLRVLELNGGRIAAELKGIGFKFTDDGRFLLSKADSKVKRELYIFDTKSWKAVTIETSEDLMEEAFGTISPDGQFVAASIEAEEDEGDVYLAIYQLKGKRLLFRAFDPAELRDPTFSPDGKVLAAASTWDGMLRLWCRHDQGEASGWEKAEFNDARLSLRSIAFSPDSRFVMAVEEKARLYDVQSPRKRLVVELGGNRGVRVVNAEFSRDGKYILTANNDGTVFLWDLNFFRSSAVKRFTPNGSTEFNLSFTGQADITSDGKLAAIVGAEESSDSVFVWDVDSGRLVRELRHHASVQSVSFSSDDKYIVTLSGETAKLWDVGSGSVVDEIQAEDNLTAASLSADRKFLLMETEGRMEVRDLDSKRVVYAAEGGADVISPDGKLILAFGEKAVEVRELSTGRLLTELSRYSDEVYSASFSPDGKYIVTTSGYTGMVDLADHTPDDADEVRIWDLSSGNVIYEFKGYGARMVSGVFSPDGKSVLALAEDGTILTYACEVCVSQDELLKLAAKRNLRPLTAEERSRYLHE